MNSNNFSLSYPFVIWITGVSGSGKSSLADKLYTLLKKDASPIVCFDGDKLREILGFEPSDVQNNKRSVRLKLAMKYAKLCQNISSQGISVIISTISMFDEIYLWNKNNISNYFEVYLKVPMHELRKRDPKKIYEDFYKGKIENVAGLDLKVDEPSSPNWKPLFNPNKSASDLASELLLKLKEGNTK